MPEPQPERQAEMTGEEALQEACERNIPVEVFRSADRGSAPAKGRLLHLDEEELVIEKLQVIGVQFELSRDTLIEGYFRYGGHLFRFDSAVKESMIAARLNGRFIVPALKLYRPKRVAHGQRRSVFRVSMGGREDAPRVQVWLAGSGDARPDESAAADGAVASIIPARRPDFTGRVVDASDTGFGLLLTNCIYSRLKPLQEVILLIELPDGSGPFEISATVRHSMAVRGSDAKVGVHLTNDGTSTFFRKIRRVTAFLTQIQRAQIR